jgi:hypothetical protein
MRARSLAREKAANGDWAEAVGCGRGRPVAFAVSRAGAAPRRAFKNHGGEQTAEHHSSVLDSRRDRQRCESVELAHSEPPCS